MIDRPFPLKHPHMIPPVSHPHLHVAGHPSWQRDRKPRTGLNMKAKLNTYIRAQVLTLPNIMPIKLTSSPMSIIGVKHQSLCMSLLLTRRWKRASMTGAEKEEICKIQVVHRNRTCSRLPWGRLLPPIGITTKLRFQNSFSVACIHSAHTFH
jgi:hypothetical protein